MLDMKILTTKFGIFGHVGQAFAGSFGALLVGWMVVVARGLYLAWHLFTLWLYWYAHKKLRGRAFGLEIRSSFLFIAKCIGLYARNDRDSIGSRICRL